MKRRKRWKWAAVPWLALGLFFFAVMPLSGTLSAVEHAETEKDTETAEHTEAAKSTESAESTWDKLCETEYESGDAGFGAATAGTEPSDIRAERLPERWYAGDYRKKPTVRHQGGDGTCWAFAAVSALETTLLPGQHIVFSADHMARKNAFTVDSEEGGDYLMAMAYLSGWQGPVTEEEDPYGDGVSPDGLSPAVHVQEMQLLEDAKPETIKAAVRKYGAVQTSLYMKRGTDRARTVSYYNEATRAYFCPDEQTENHDVIILGWDDHFSRFLFSETPERDGAFICQNTWEEGFGEDGIFYVSYEDPNIAKSCVCYTGIEPTDNYSRILQYDDCGWQGRQGYADGTCWLANAYVAAGDESLAAVGFYAVGPDTSYEIYLVHDFQGEESFQERAYLQRGQLQNAGYYTAVLDTPQQLAPDERFAIVVKITTPGEENPVAVEYRADEYTQNVTTAGKESYLSQYGELWENTQKRFGTNVCLKAYMLSATE